MTSEIVRPDRRILHFSHIIETARFGIREFFVFQPPHIVLTTLLPRAVLQCLFFTMLGGVLGGAAGREYAFVGSLAGILPLAGTVGVSDVPAHDKWSATFYRIRTASTMQPFLLYLLRCLPFPVQGFVTVLLSLVIVAPVIGLTGTAVDLVPLLPLYFLMAMSTTAAGMAGAAFAIGRRADVFMGNLLQYLILLAGGVFLPPGRVAWVDAIGIVLPIRHGLAAVRAALAGEPWLRLVATEVAVGLGWLAATWLIVALLARRARRLGHDEYI